MYKGYIVMPNPASSGTGFLTVSAILQIMGEEKRAGTTSTSSIRTSPFTPTPDPSRPRWPEKASIPIGISFAYRGFKQKAAGEPVIVAFPEEKSGWELEANGLINKPIIKEEAKVFLDWANSDDAIKMYGKVYAIIASNAVTVARCRRAIPTDPAQQLIENDFDWAAMNRDEILKKWTETFDSKSEAEISPRSA